MLTNFGTYFKAGDRSMFIHFYSAGVGNYQSPKPRENTQRFFGYD